MLNETAHHPPTFGDGIEVQTIRFKNAQTGKPWLPPTAEQINSPEFDAVWSAIRDWDIAVPAVYGGICSATGAHVRAILDALAEVRR